MSVETERSAGRVAFVVVRAAVLAGAWWYLAVALARLFDAVVGVAGLDGLSTGPAGFAVTASAFVVAFGLVFCAVAYWHYRVRLLGWR
ncbi:hypothetical protein [Halegenticoccus tardaugens]|uniref:hypothetical protein n=1 Tax=Halegenticoccus tardaugens TaxID=2071624 RepID=UPI00100ADB55|nr:hypothetical protein [Halegenticoccus tardaugens]